VPAAVPVDEPALGPVQQLLGAMLLRMVHATRWRTVHATQAYHSLVSDLDSLVRVLGRIPQIRGERQAARTAARALSMIDDLMVRLHELRPPHPEPTISLGGSFCQWLFGAPHAGNGTPEQEMHQALACISTDISATGQQIRRDLALQRAQRRAEHAAREAHQECEAALARQECETTGRLCRDANAAMAGNMRDGYGFQSIQFTGYPDAPPSQRSVSTPWHRS
jgi:hypothetical protein